MDIRLIAIDLDGTALSADRLHFTPRLEACLLEVHRRGISVLPVTGRQYGLLPPALRTDAPWRDLVVLCNGSQVRCLTDGALLDACFFPAGTLLRLADLAGGLDIPVEFSADSVLYLTEESLRLQSLHETQLDFHLHQILPRHGRLAGDLPTLLRGPDFACEKVNLPYIPPELHRQAEEALNALPVSWAWSGPCSVEISPAGVTKASGLRSACALLGVGLGDVLALGDSGNDVPMLRLAGLGVAMGGAPPEVRAAADAVTATLAEDGAALAIERWVLAQS